MQIISTIRDNGAPPVATRSGQEPPAPASAQDERSSRKLCRNELPRFRRTAMCWLRNPEDAEDAVQDAMLSAYKHIGAFNGRARLSTWITAIVINSVRMQLRRRPRYQVLSLDQTPDEGQVSISEFIADPRPTPEQALERNELRDLVTKVTSSLSASQRAALCLHQRDGLSIREAARKLGVPEGTLKAQLARGRAALTRRFQKVEGKRRTKAAITDGSAKRRDCCSGYGPDPARCEVPEPSAGFQSQQGGYEAWVSA